MRTFVKKLSRDSEFAVVIPEEVKRQYNLLVGQTVSFEVVRRDNGFVVIQKEAIITSVEGDTEIVFSTGDLTVSGFNDDVIYDDRIIAYASISDSSSSSNVNLDTQYFDSIQMITQDIFLMGDESSVQI